MCLWDIETALEIELQDWDVPDVLRGYIPKHSQYFYQRRVEYTLPMLTKTEAPAARYDDATVSYDKLARYPEAVSLLEEKEKKFPGMYETYANWGTILSHAGQFKEGLAHLKKAVQINPEAHFGREHYQIDFIEHMQRLKEDPTLSERTDFLGIDLQQAEEELADPKAELGLEKMQLEDDVFGALTGMMRFGGADKHPLFWFSLGLSLGYKGGRYFGLQALRRAEVLGHPKARSFGEKIYTAAKQESWPTKPYTRRSLYDSYEKLADFFDKDFAEGQADVAEEQANEDALLQKGDTSLFGY